LWLLWLDLARSTVVQVVTGRGLRRLLGTGGCGLASNYQVREPLGDDG